MTASGGMFGEIALILLLAAVLGGIGLMLRQPLIVSFIGVGIVVGPAGLGIVTHGDELELPATIGIALLLFVVGLRLDLGVIRTMGPVALATGLGQVAFTSIIGFAICLALGYGPVGSAYVAVALTFSSTIIIVKLLSDKREIDSLHGRIAVGFLIVQDIVAVLALIALSALGSAGGGAGEAGAEGGLSVLGVLGLIGRGVLLLAVIGVLARYVLPRVSGRLAHNHEALVLFAIAWAVALSAGGEALGYSKEVGAFLAGVSLASTRYREAISSRLVSLRDFLLLFFFINLGASLDLSRIGGDLLPALLLSVFVLVGNPLIVMVIMGFMGYRKRTGFLAGLTVAQISEFSLILAAMGVRLGHLDPGLMGVVTLVGMVTICLSTYMILYSHPLYERLAPLMGVFERANPFRESRSETSVPARSDVVLFGLGRFGGNIARGLRERGLSVFGVDFDPVVVRQWREKGWPAQYGDAEDPEFAASLPLAEAAWVVCAIPQLHVNQSLLGALREQGFTGKVALAAHSAHDEARLRHAGAHVVLLPFRDAAARAVDEIAGGGGEAPSPAASPAAAGTVNADANAQHKEPDPSPRPPVL